MTLSLHSSWTEAASREKVEPVFLLTLTDGVSTWKAQSAPHATMTYGMGVLEVGELAPEIDVMTRRLEVGEVEVVVSDAWLRPILTANRLFGKKATLQLGFYDTAEANFANYHIGSVDAILPDGIGKTVRLSLMSALELARKQQIVGYWIGEHPLDVIYDILINKLGVHADLVDASSLDPDTYTGISHFVVSRLNQSGVIRAITEPTSGFSVIDELAQLCNGTLYVNEGGQVSFRIFDPTASEAATWTTSDIVSLEQVSLDKHMVNRCEVTMDPSIPAVRIDNNVGFAQEDDDSILALAYPGTTERRVTHKIDTNWLMGAANLSVDGVSQDVAIGVTANIILHGSNAGNFTQAVCGTREGYPTVDQPTNAKISAARPLYLLTDAGEIISATGMVPTAGVTGAYSSWVTTADPEDGSSVRDGPHHDSWTLSGVTRGALGSVEAVAAACIDITIPVYLATAIVDRHAYGVSVVEVTTTLRHYDKEPGDLVKLVWPAYLDFGKDGIDGTDGKFEIVSKEVDAKSGLIKWGLAWAGLNTPTYTYVAAVGRATGSLVNQAFQFAEGEYAVSRHIASGLGVTNPSGMDIRIASGRAAAGSLTFELPSSQDITLEASKDYYVILDLVGKTVLYETNNGGTAPTLTGTQIRLAKVVTDATKVASIDTTTSVPVKALSGTKIVGASIPTAAYAVGSVDSTAIGERAVATSNIATGAVTAPTVARAAIGPVHQVMNSKKKGMFANAQFSIASKG